jgi:hypothetical protein
MMKSMFALLFLGALAIASAAGSTPAVAAPTPPHSGTCHWFCGTTQFRTQAACVAACGPNCEPIC